MKPASDADRAGKAEPGRPAGPFGPLAGVKVVEFAGIGPGPFACMMLADMGADVISLVRPGSPRPSALQFAFRGRRRLEVDLKNTADQERVLSLLDKADMVVESFRPGVMERLGLGPEVVLGRNPRLVYGRMTGWGQTGPLARAAGHDINYIAITGALHAIGTREKPVPPLNLLGDYGGGSLYLLVGLLAALHSARESGIGQVVDAAICDGVLSMLTPQAGRMLQGLDVETRESNMLDGGAAWYGVYRTADDEYVSVGAIEPQFHARLCELLGIDPALRPPGQRPGSDEGFRQALTRVFATRTRAQWAELLEGSDACFAPVLRLSEARAHPHLIAREAFVEIDGVVQPAPAPRFSRTPARIRSDAATSADAEWFDV